MKSLFQLLIIARSTVCINIIFITEFGNLYFNWPKGFHAFSVIFA